MWSLTPACRSFLIEPCAANRAPLSNVGVAETTDVVACFATQLADVMFDAVRVLAFDDAAPHVGLLLREVLRERYTFAPDVAVPTKTGETCCAAHTRLHGISVQEVLHGSEPRPGPCDYKRTKATAKKPDDRAK